MKRYTPAATDQRSGAFLERSVQLDLREYIDGTVLAELFWAMDEYEQADFFSALGKFQGLPMQLQAVTDCGHLEFEGRMAMQRIGEYAGHREGVGV